MTDLDELLAKLKPVEESAPITKPNDFLIKEPTVKSEPVGMDKRIEESKRFNESLRNEELLKETILAATDVRPNKDTELRSILKRYGMDSQQQEKAFREVKILFE